LVRTWTWYDPMPNLSLSKAVSLSRLMLLPDISCVAEACGVLSSAASMTAGSDSLEVLGESGDVVWDI